jgi:hypothetical protein
MKPIFYGRHNITQSDVDAVISVLKSDFLTQGPKIKEFEEAFANYIGAKYAVAVSNGTAALHLCTLALEVKPGDKVITTPITFAASANCVRYAGGEVVFADIDPETYLLDIKEVEKLLKASPKGTYKGIIPVDFSGRAVNLEAFRKLADEYGCWIIEDACHAPGGYFTDSKNHKHNCGNGDYAELAIFSFHPVKHIAAGEGGMITTNDEKLYKRLQTLRTHGITKDVNLFQNSLATAYGFKSMADDPMTTNNARGANNPAITNDSMRRKAQNDYPGWYMEMQELGFNYRLTDFQAALGLSQLNRADEGLARRREIASLYEQAFSGKSFIKRQSGVIDGHAYHLYIVEVEDRIGLYDYLRDKNIFAQVHYIPVHLMPYYKQFGWKEGDMPNAEDYYKHCISLPMFPSLTNEEQNFVINTIYTFFNE